MTTLHELLEQKANNIENVKSTLALFVYHELIQTSLNELDALIAEKDVEKAFAMAEALRDKLLIERNKQANAAVNKNYFAAIHQALILLACYWSKNSSGELADPIDCEFITDETEVVPVSQGYLYIKSNIFKNHFQRVDKEGNSLVLKQDDAFNHLLGVQREKITEFDLETIQRSGVDIPGLPPLPDKVYENALAYRKTTYAVLFQREQGWANNIKRLFHPASLLEWGALLFGLIGTACGVLALWPIISTAVAALTPEIAMAIGAMGGFSLLTGFVRGRFEGYDVEDQVEGLSTLSNRLLIGNLSMMSAVFISIVMIGVVAFTLPYLTSFLVSISLLSSAQAALVSANMGLIGIIVPATIGVIGFLHEPFSRGGMSRFFVDSVLALITLPGLIARDVGMVLGAIGHLAASGVARLNRPQVDLSVPLPKDQTPQPVIQDLLQDLGNQAHMIRQLGAEQGVLEAANDTASDLSGDDAHSIKQALGLSDDQYERLVQAEQDDVFQPLPAEDNPVAKADDEENEQAILRQNGF